MKRPVNPSAPPGGRPAATGVTTWYIRHGHNPANQARQLSHRVVDYPLSDLGVAQATGLGERLAREQDIAPVIYASPLRRAAQTAEIIARCTGGDVEVIEDLRELNVGDIDGRRDDEAWAMHDQILAQWRAGHHDTAFPGGEDYHGVAARLTRALEHALRHPSGSRVLVVAHIGIIRAGLPAICPGAQMPAAELRNCDMAELEIRPARGGITGTLHRWPVMLGEGR